MILDFPVSLFVKAKRSQFANRLDDPYRKQVVQLGLDLVFGSANLFRYLLAAVCEFGVGVE